MYVGGGLCYVSETTCLREMLACFSVKKDARKMDRTQRTLFHGLEAVSTRRDESDRSSDHVGPPTTPPFLLVSPGWFKRALPILGALDLRLLLF